MSAPGYPSPQQPPYPMPQPSPYGGAPYSGPPGGYGDPGQAPPVGFQMGYQPQPGQPVMYQPGPANPMPYQSPMANPEFGAGNMGQGPMATGSPAVPMSVAVGVPPGLEYLTQIDQILVHQKVELLEAFIGFETNNKYEIKNSMGQKIYNAKEKNDCCTRNCCGSLRSFDMKIKDNTDREVIRLVRPFRCASCWCPCCLQELEVQAPPGTTIGYVVQDWHPCLPKFSILGPSRETILKLDGPCCACNCCGDINFELKGKDGDAPIGRISKQWSGLLKEAFTDADNFGIQFPLDMDVKVKAVLLGACFLIDFMFFEKVNDEKQRNTVFS
ncbi:phospholipid scramblase 3b isoform X1 [Brienomyrus brachyistius]|uniref:phospholipid scramblase 3b isoform X1 n=2 Tax=Brienomyrus brachyistius TaxID=42636 RepID=UPI0020B194FD|nr:phospholipid scramblase 3b isoform X1 [Brienomyrus brachyistius]XP_048883405.1 phospholipid scramblase 3b isoform X1 [Brienomyrus brachyistius]XP_048883406.1 phospholipid scramblase 3b isoform X1 [Brienomyrus brachyistius]XP_048883407.1 phospholipid scramblase 3b isoform X1 [Brienomyrus brachyistius]XP_048883408.1 phospholipid scramblase 3b isoform X1 [Brienomyrus brachyistius]